MSFNAFTEMRENKQGASAESKKHSKVDKNDIKNITNSTEGSILRQTLKTTKEAENKPETREASQYAKSEKSYELKETKKLSEMDVLSNKESGAEDVHNNAIQQQQKTPEASTSASKEEQTKFITFVDNKGQEYKVPNTARAKAQIAKQEQEVELQKLLNQEAGIVDWTKKYSEFDTEKKKWTTDAEKTSKFFQEFGEKFATNPMEGLMLLSEKMNLSPIKVKRLLRETIGKETQEYYSLEENQRQLFDLKEENEYNQKILEKMNKQRTANTENEIYEAGMREVMQVNNISQEKRSEIEEWVIGDSGKKLSADDLAFYSKEHDRINSLYDVAADISPELEQDEDLIAFLDARTARNPDMSKIEIKRLAKRYLGAGEVAKKEEDEERSAEILKPKMQETVAPSAPKIFNKPVRVSDLLK